MFEHVINGKINVIIISYKDRLTGFGFKYLKEFFSSHHVRIDVMLIFKPKSSV